jgi:glutamate racemase
VIPLIEQVVGKNVRVIDPAPSVAKQVKRLLEAAGTKNQPQAQSASVRFFTSGDAAAMKSVLPVLLGESGEVESVTWKNDCDVA